MRRLGVDRGLFEGRRIWLVLGTVAWTVKAIQWVAKRDDSPVVFQGAVSAGERLLITATDPRSVSRGRRRRGHH